MSIVIEEISRVIAHEVVKAREGTPSNPPQMSDSLMLLTDVKAKGLMFDRINSTIGQGSKSVDVQVETPAVFHILTSMLDADDDQFIHYSKDLANALSLVQTAGTIKAGVAVFIQGKCFYNDESLRFIAVIKADPDQALHRTYKCNRIELDYVNNILFGTSNRLLKIGFFIEEQKLDSNTEPSPRKPEDFTIKVFDHLMNNSSDANAARYFYQAFLGCKLAETSAVQSKKFFEFTNAFIMDSNLKQEEKETCRGGLFAFMRSNKATIDASEFAREFLPTEIQSQYIGYCNENNILTAFSKDNALILSKLKKRTIRFSSKVTIYASTDILDDNVKIEDQDEDGWTLVKIKGKTVK